MATRDARAKIEEKLKAYCVAVYNKRVAYKISLQGVNIISIF